MHSMHSSHQKMCFILYVSLTSTSSCSKVIFIGAASEVVLHTDKLQFSAAESTGVARVIFV